MIISKKVNRQVYALAFVLTAYGASVAAETTYINCPVSRARADVSTKLPEGWYYTPTDGKLKTLRVQTIGADRVLVCLYQAFDGQVAIVQKVSAGLGACYADKKQQRFACQTKSTLSPAATPSSVRPKTELTK